MDNPLIRLAHKTAKIAGLTLCALIFVLPNSRGAAVRIGWDASESPYVSSYRIYHSGNPAGSLPGKWELAGITTNLTFLHTNVALGDHRWMVTAVAFGVESEPSPPVTLTIARPAPPLTVGARIAGTNVMALFRSTDLQKWEKLCQWDEPADELSFFRIEFQELLDDPKQVRPLSPVTQGSSSRSRLRARNRFP